MLRKGYCCTLTTWREKPTHWKRPWCWERLRVGGEGGDRGWDGWTASSTQWTWVWPNSRWYWRTGKPGVLQSMRLQRQTRLSGWTPIKFSTCNTPLKVKLKNMNVSSFSVMIYRLNEMKGCFQLCTGAAGHSIPQVLALRGILHNKSS